MWLHPDHPAWHLVQRGQSGSTAFPAILWPAPRMESSNRCSAANLTAWLTSPSVLQSTMRPGRRSIMAFQIVQASSYPLESGVSKSPSRALPKAATSSALSETLAPSSEVRSGTGGLQGSFLGWIEVTTIHRKKRRSTDLGSAPGVKATQAHQALRLSREHRIDLRQIVRRRQLPSAPNRSSHDPAVTSGHRRLHRYPPDPKPKQRGRARVPPHR